MHQHHRCCGDTRPCPTSPPAATSKEPHVANCYTGDSRYYRYRDPPLAPSLVLVCYTDEHTCGLGILEGGGCSRRCWCYTAEHTYANVSWVYLAVGGAIGAPPIADPLSYWDEHCRLNTSTFPLTFSAARTGRDGKSISWHRSRAVLLLRGAVIRDKAVRWQDGSLASWGDLVSCLSEMAR